MISATHHHIIATLNTLLGARKGIVRQCDAGCGSGALLALIATDFRSLRPDIELELYGFDVSDSGVQADGFFDKAIDLLSESDRNVDWHDRLRLITSKDRWPFADGFLDVVVSNQVLEHVTDHVFFMSEHHRALCEGGMGIHLYPSQEILWEGHVHLPIAHRFRQYSLRRSYIRVAGYVFPKPYLAHRAAFGISRDVHAEEHADYLGFWTNYTSTTTMLDTCKRARLRADFGFTIDYFWAALRRKLGLKPILKYKTPRAIRALALPFLRALGDVTLHVEKRQTYFR